MSHVGQFRQSAEERHSPRRRVSSVWKYSPPTRASEYHLIDLATVHTLAASSSHRTQHRIFGATIERQVIETCESPGSFSTTHRGEITPQRSNRGGTQT